MRRWPGVDAAAVKALWRTLRAVFRLLRVLIHGLHGLAIVALRFRGLDDAGRHARIAHWAQGLLRALGLRLQVQGRPRPGAKLIVANHVSWLDIMAIHAVCPQARFVSKADVRHWPLVSRLVDAAGTLYLERDKRRDALRVVHQMAQALAAGQSVAVFPEGTTSDGRSLLPFHANLLQAAIATATPVQPVALRYADAAEPISRSARYVDHVSLARSLWWLACGEGLVVHVHLLSALGSAHAERRALAARAREAIADELRPHGCTLRPAPGAAGGGHDAAAP
jgi:1-acyl-sn-glycerol-3-phosphate acyltransferase